MTYFEGEEATEPAGETPTEGNTSNRRNYCLKELVVPYRAVYRVYPTNGEPHGRKLLKKYERTTILLRYHAYQARFIASFGLYYKGESFFVLLLFYKAALHGVVLFL